MNSIRNNFDHLIATIKGNFDILIISEENDMNHYLPCNSTLMDTIFLGQIEMLRVRGGGGDFSVCVG